jgi:hypothetical protein
MNQHNHGNRTLTVQDLDDPQKDEYCTALIKNRCDSFRVPEEGIQQIVNGDGTRQSAIDYASAAFGARIDHEIHVIRDFQRKCLGKLPSLEKSIDKEKQILDELQDKGLHTQADTVENIPRSEKIRQSIYYTFAWILMAGGLIQLGIFLRMQIGLEWWQAFIIPLTGVIAIALAFKAALDVHVVQQPKWFLFCKYLLLFSGIGCAVAWLFMYSQYAMIMTRPVFTGLNGSAVEDSGHGSSIMIALQVLAEALVAGFLFTKVKDISDRNTSHNGVRLTERYVHHQKKLDVQVSEHNRLNSRKSLTEGLLSLISSRRHLVEQ